MTMEPLCRVIEEIKQWLLRFKEKPFRSGAFNLRISVSSVAAIILTIHGEPGPWGSPPSRVPMRSPGTEQTVAVASGRTKSAWPGPAFVVFVSRPLSSSLCPPFPSTTLCGNTASLWRWAGADGSDLSFPFVEAFPKVDSVRNRGFVSRVGSETGSKAPMGRSTCRGQLKATSVPGRLEGTFPRPRRIEGPPGSKVRPGVTAAKRRWSRIGTDRQKASRSRSRSHQAVFDVVAALPGWWEYLPIAGDIAA